eukprot:TRINITY_DN28213_c0_g1_i1.p1 TRINITY_DN28213_c0_g1~~TRINITY_DN28213_c0_g1_i1.p1  ORF type:complete len:371 (-),score=53.01 TRINITY_DN28213_c0_g1_i1:13-1125(-)
MARLGRVFLLCAALLVADSAKVLKRKIKGSVVCPPGGASCECNCPAATAGQAVAQVSPLHPGIAGALPGEPTAQNSPQIPRSEKDVKPNEVFSVGVQNDPWEGLSLPPKPPLPPPPPPLLPPEPPAALPPPPVVTDMTTNDLPTLGPPPLPTLPPTNPPLAYPSPPPLVPPTEPPYSYQLAKAQLHIATPPPPVQVPGFNWPGVPGLPQTPIPEPKPEEYHYYQFVPGRGYFKESGIAGDEPQPAPIKLSEQSSARKTHKGCSCQAEWSYGGTPCTESCCNPDSEPSGDWCFVSDPSCQGAAWGFCSYPMPVAPTATSFIQEPSSVQKKKMQDAVVKDTPSRALKLSFLQKHDDRIVGDAVEGAECECEV